MKPTLIRLQDGTVVEVEPGPQEAQQIAGGMRRVQASMKDVQPVLVNVARSVRSAWGELNKDMTIEGAEVELGLSFEGEGTVYVAKAKAGANLTVKLVLKPEEGPAT